MNLDLFVIFFLISLLYQKCRNIKPNDTVWKIKKNIETQPSSQPSAYCFPGTWSIYPLPSHPTDREGLLCSLLPCTWGRREHVSSTMQSTVVIIASADQGVSRESMLITTQTWPRSFCWHSGQWSVRAASAWMEYGVSLAWGGCVQEGPGS